MKYRAPSISLLLLLFLASSSAVAQEDDRPSWTVQVDPATTALGFVHVQVERTIGDHASVYLGPHFRLFSPPFGEQEDFVGFGGEVGVRYYFAGRAPEGWWLLGRNVVAQLRTDTNTEIGGYTSLVGGYTAIINDWMVLSGGVGIQYLWYDIDGMGPSGPFPAFHTALGVAF